MINSVRTPAGIRVGPTRRGNFYLAINRHQYFAPSRKNRWSKQFNHRHQFNILDQAEHSRWLDTKENLWGIALGLLEIGVNQECIAKFPKRPNDNDDWHGYPVSALDRNRELEHLPSTELVSQWFDAGLIDEFQQGLINRGKV